jgi:hypothetical protein
MRINKAECAGCPDRIHYIDPRADLISVLPDGMLWQTIKDTVDRLAESGNFAGAVILLYEALLHPLFSIKPQAGKGFTSGRLSGSFVQAYAAMTPSETAAFDSAWTRHIDSGIEGLGRMYGTMQDGYGSRAPPSILSRLFFETSEVSDFKAAAAEFMDSYKEVTCKFLDLWVIAKIIVTCKSVTVSDIVLYSGSLHALQIAEYLEDLGYDRIKTVENPSYDSCLRVV